MKAQDTIHCFGHVNVRALHRTTFEVTKEADLSPAGDCIIGVSADKGAADLDPALKALLTDDRAEVTTRLCAGGVEVVVRSHGSAAFSLDHPSDLVWRRSTFACGRTVAVGSDTVAGTIDRRLIAALAAGAELVVEIEASVPELGPGGECLSTAFPPICAGGLLEDLPAFSLSPDPRN